MKNLGKNPSPPIKAHVARPTRARHRWPLTFFLILFNSIVCFRALGQSYAIDWHTIDGGGCTSTGGVYSVSGTIGQHDAGTMSGGNYTMNGGFWGIIAAVQTPGAPLLSITRSNNLAIISWPDTAAGFRLENNNDLSITIGWTTAPQTRATNGGFISITIPSSAGNCFYRLRNP